MKHFTYLLALIISYHSYSQSGDCEGRYQYEIFSDVDVETVIYSEPYNLAMDIYTPVGDEYTNRPLIIFAHGGSFIGGSKTTSLMIELCETFAKKGYVTASINYRLATNATVLGTDFGSFGGLTWMTNLNNGIKVIYSAFTDAKAAVRFFRKNAIENNNPYGIDVDQIWMGGNSAGAVLAPHIAYVSSLDEFINGIDESGQDYAQSLANSNGGIDGNSGNNGYSSTIQGVINLAGAIHTVDWISEDELTPIVSCHGTEDETVPDECGTILNSPLNLTACGSIAMHPIIESYGAVNDLLIYEGAGHVPWDLNTSDREEMFSFISEFLYNNTNCNQTINIQESLKSNIILNKIDVLGRVNTSPQKGFAFSIYDDGSVVKEYILK